MCRIVTVRYVTPDGRRRSTERRQLCVRSDGTTPCQNREYSEVTELVSSGTPSLVHEDDIPSPASASIPGTPLTATANYEYREPFPETGESSSKGKGRKGFGLYLDLSSKRKKDGSPGSPRRGRRSNCSYSGSSNGDADSIVAIEEDGIIEPLSPARSKRNSFGSHLSMRRTRQPTVVSQPKPPPTPPSVRSHHPTASSKGRPSATGPDFVRFEEVDDNEVMDRANARDQLRRETRERWRRQDALKSSQEASERRKAAEVLEAEEKAKDDYARREYERLQEKDRLRQEKAEQARILELEKKSRDEIETIEREIKELQERDAVRKREKEEADIAQAARQREKEMRNEEARIESKLQEELERIHRQSRDINRTQLQDVQTHIDNMESELAKQRQRREARERAEQLEQEIRYASVLEDDIRELEDEHRRDDDLRRLESQLRDLQVDRQRYIPPLPQLQPLSPLPRSPSRSPRDPAQIMQQYSPYDNPEYRRSIGEQILQQERDRATARVQAASAGLQGMIAGPPPSRRGGGTIVSSSGNARDGRYKEYVYRDVGRRYPD